MADELTPEQIAANEQAEKDFNAKLVQRFGTTDLMKKADQVKVLTEEEKAEAEEKKRSDILKFGLDQRYISAKDQEDYIAALKGDKIEIARKKFIAKNPDLGKEAGKIFDTIIRKDEDDEIADEVDQEKLMPNVTKKAALVFAQQLADEDIDTRFSRIKELPKKFEEYQEQQKLKAENSELIKKAHAALPRRYDDEISGVKFGIDFSEEDMQEALAVVQPEITRPGLKEEDAKNAMATYLWAKNAKRFVTEGIRLGYNKGQEDAERGQKGLLKEKAPEGSGGISAKRQAMIKSGILDGPK